MWTMTVSLHYGSALLALHYFADVEFILLPFPLTGLHENNSRRGQRWAYALAADPCRKFVLS